MTASRRQLVGSNHSIVLGLIAGLLMCGGCNPSHRESPEPAAPEAPSETATPSERSAADQQEPAEQSENVVTASSVVELDPDALLAKRLPMEQSEQGWIRLFDGQSFFGWQVVDGANWRIEDGVIVVDEGEQSFLATSLPWEDYELQLEYKADEQTNSGIFLRTPLRPQDPATECYELNIAPGSNPFPTGSLVGRNKVDAEAIGETAGDQWHRYDIRVEGGNIQVHHDGELVCDYTDPNPLPAGRISLQHNEGRIAFQNIRLRPLNLQSLLASHTEQAEDAGDQESDDSAASDSLAQWKRYPEMPGEFTWTEEGNLHVTGGRGQLESRQAYGDFVLLTTCRTNAEDLNSGIFFRCIPGEQMNGYECQISNEMVDGNPMQPADFGTGGIFRRSPARIIAAEDESWFSLVLVAAGPKMAAWVNGIQVSEWQDPREPDANPRRGLRTEPGTLMIQAHDPTTDILFGKFEVAAIGELPELAWPGE